MHARVALVVLAFVASAGLTAAAEERSVESPEALKAILDQAMPELLKGNVPDVLKKITPDEYIEGLSRELHSTFNPYEAKVGSPIDWVYVGMRKRGDMFRQYVYVCRRDYGTVIWRFTAAEDTGQWRLFGAQHDSNCVAILAHSVVDTASKDTDHARLADDVVAALAHGRGNAIDLLKASLLIRDPEKDPALRNTVEKLMAMIARGGGVEKLELVESRNVAGVIAGRCYLVRYERVLLRFRFLLYRPGKEWKLLDFDYHTVGNGEDVFGSAPLEPSLPAAASDSKQTTIGSRELKAEDGQKK